MAVFAATDYRIEIATVNLSAYVTSVELPIDIDKLETTGFGSTWESSIGGIRRATVTINFNQDFATSTVAPTIWSNLGASVAIKLRPTSGTISATNPELQFNAIVLQDRPIGASVGQLATLSVTWPVSGTITRATS